MQYQRVTKHLARMRKGVGEDWEGSLRSHSPDVVLQQIRIRAST